MSLSVRPNTEGGYKAPTCACGHPVGDHQSNRAPFPHPLRYGRCLAGCGCTEYREVKADG